MLDKNTMIKVMNRSSGSVSYTVPDLGITRFYEHGEIKEVTFEELQKLSYSTGGLILLKKYLLLNDPEAINELIGEVEPEYYYGEKEVKELLENGSLAQLEDCLNFATEGVLDMVQKMAVDLEINDVSKRDLILKKTGFNVNNAITVNHLSKDENEEEAAPAQRRAAPITVDKQPQRKAEPPKYKVTSM